MIKRRCRICLGGDDGQSSISSFSTSSDFCCAVLFACFRTKLCRRIGRLCCHGDNISSISTSSNSLTDIVASDFDFTVALQLILDQLRLAHSELTSFMDSEFAAIPEDVGGSYGRYRMKKQLADVVTNSARAIARSEIATSQTRNSHPPIWTDPNEDGGPEVSLTTMEMDSRLSSLETQLMWMTSYLNVTIAEETRRGTWSRRVGWLRQGRDVFRRRTQRVAHRLSDVDESLLGALHTTLGDVTGLVRIAREEINTSLLCEMTSHPTEDPWMLNDLGCQW